MIASSRPRAAVWAFAVGALVVGAVLGLAGPAQAHNYLVASTPEPDSVLTALPEEFSVTTNAALLDLSGTASGFAIRIVDGAGAYYGDGCVRVEGSSMYTSAQLGEPGEYTFLWQLVSEDGHSVSGEFGFAWDPTDSSEISEGFAQPPVCSGAAVSETAPPEEVTQDEPADTDTVWLIGAVGAVALAVVATVLLLRRRRA